MSQRFRWAAHLLLTLALLAAPAALAQQAGVPHPADVFGFTPGDDYKLADYGQMLDYYERLDAASDRVHKIEIGHTAMGKPMILLFISSEENLRQLDRWKGIAQRLASGQLSDEEARRLAAEGKAIVWIDGGMHATEKAHGQMTSLLAHRVVTEESEEMRQIRDDVVLLLMPVMNPDGMNIVVDWYRRNLGTPFEQTNPPELYHKYVGHDNNRDWYMLLMPESQAVARQLYHEWLPQIVYNHHQSSPEWTRIFVPPFADPVNPNIAPEVITGVNLVGQAMHKRYADLGMPGAISRLTFDMWWNGGMRTAPYYHNMIGILTETAHTSPTPRFYDPDSIPATVGGRRAGAIPTAYPSIFYPDPWQGGWSRFADAVSYMMEASMAVLNLGAVRSEDWLYGMHRMASRAVQQGQTGGPFAYVIPADQWDSKEAVELVNVLRRGGVAVHRATTAVQAGNRTIPAGSYVVYAGQPFRAHLVDLLEPQDYPHREMYPGGPPEPPYDMAGWTLPMQMGVRVERIEEPFQASLAAVGVADMPAGQVVGTGGQGYLLSPNSNAAIRAVARLLRAGERVSVLGSNASAEGRTFGAGSYLVENRGARTRERVQALAGELGVDFVATSRPEARAHRLRLPRIGLYKSWIPNMDEGWTRWVLEQYELPFDTLHDADIRGGDLSRYHAIVLPDQNAEGILRGHRPGQMPEQFVGGVGPEGAAALRRYVERGGTVVALDHASDFAIEQLGAPVRNVLKDVPPEEFFIPGSLMRIEVDQRHPVAFGMQDETAAFFVRSQAFEVPNGADVEVVARYSEDDLLMSGWAHGADEHLAGRAAVVRAPLGAGSIVLVGFRSQFRAQPRGTFKLLLNPLMHSTTTIPATPAVPITSPQVPR